MKKPKKIKENKKIEKIPTKMLLYFQKIEAEVALLGLKKPIFAAAAVASNKKKMRH